MSNNNVCKYCNGKGYVTVECTACNGEGIRWVTIPDGTNRKGLIPCPDEDCRGYGHYRRTCICRQ